jgi:putative FmdB family regulatory protein
MPIYEWQCGKGHVFEMIARADAAKKRSACPSCGTKSERLISTFAIRGGMPIETASERAAARDIDVTSIKLPNVARLCGMDDYSATRLAAHKLGRGNEFDDKMAVRKELQNARGHSPKKAAAHKQKHSHSH